MYATLALTDIPIMKEDFGRMLSYGGNRFSEAVILHPLAIPLYKRAHQMHSGAREIIDVSRSEGEVER